MLMEVFVLERRSEMLLLGLKLGCSFGLGFTVCIAALSLGGGPSGFNGNSIISTLL
jgi:hypothetical protein